jgi:tRNA(Glu) U13 pseudouridine synthase TruD
MEGIVRVSIVATGIKTDINSKPIDYEASKQNSKKTEAEIKTQQNDFRKEYPQNLRATQNDKSYKEDKITDDLPSNTIRFPSNKPLENVEDEIIFEDAENSNLGVDSGTFFIPPAARRVSHIKNNKEVNYKSNNNGLFSKIFNKKD